VCGSIFLRTLNLPQGFGAGLGQAHGGCGVWGGDGDVREDLVAGEGGRPVPAAGASESRRHGGNRLLAFVTAATRWCTQQLRNSRRADSCLVIFPADVLQVRQGGVPPPWRGEQPDAN
jgi:hypothetical protein